ncbi:hypothetical protein BUALT_Bualt15G0058500 [Buddleja alternifolia]|uniref:NB-ARC domain-containing protein n=1 Tax=Buddleja alternifolia TaxID=168488 RepID=A0AAV6WD61_9LAMI|nr:hypothetical protein BUALT_Bualt15G0058500 [Buddleja alternifolia]
MAAYTAVVTLLHDLKHLVRSYDRTFGSAQGFPFSKDDLKILYRNFSFIDSFLRDYESRRRSFNNNNHELMLEKRIGYVARKAAIFLEFWEVECLSHSILTQNKAISEGSTTILSEIAEEMRSITKKLKKIRDDDRKLQGESFTFLNPSRRAPNTEGKLVGLENDLVTMLDSLTGLASQLKVFSIIGMAGIGKTTFAKKLYDHPLVMHHFYVRAWITVSQQYQVKEMLLGVLRCVTNASDEIYERSEEELREQVYRSLKGKRYLIVLDDMWDTKAWDDLRIAFPDDKNGSRIMLTSQLRDAAVHASQNIPPHCLRCLSADESWELLCSKIFVNESCPVEFVEIGKQIAFKCQGLPLALVVLGGLLSKMNKKADVWEEVTKSIGSLVMEDAEHCQNVLALSYNHLPDHLKPCFLYMGIFPEDYEISVKKLIYLWVAEGFIRPRKEKGLEEVAEEYLEDLVTRSLVFVKRKRSNGRIKICYIHDLMRDLCLRESQKQNFLHVINNSEQLPLKNLHHDNLRHLGIRQIPQNSLHNLRRLSFHSNIHMYIGRTSFPYTRSVMCFETLSLSNRQARLWMNLKLLKVLDIMNIHLRTLPGDILRLTQLKFLALTIQDSLNISHFVSMFHSLQIFIIDCEQDIHFTSSFWNMPELRHFHLMRSCLTYSPTSSSVLEVLTAETAERVGNNLQSLSTVRPISCTKKVFLGMPNLKKLGVRETAEDHNLRGWFEKLVYLEQLETLKYTFSNPFVSSNLKPYRLPLSDNFLPKLVKLTLSGNSFPWEDMLQLSKLPKLEVLKLRNYAFSGALWKCREGGFRCLKFLLIGSTDLEIWEADGTHFPKLERLVLRHCRSLKEIPYCIGEAPLLENITLHCCKDSAVMSARNLQEEQESMGNDGLTVHITEG